MRKLFDRLPHPKNTRFFLLLALVLLVLILLSGLPALLDRTDPPTWIAPAVPSSTPSPSPTPGWWNTLPTPIPLNPTPKGATH